MATKFSTTTNISSFTSADIAKLTPAEIGTFTKEQQSGLTASQAIGLTDKQVASLPLKNVTPDAIAAIPLKSIVSLAIGSLSTAQTAALTNGEIGALTSTQVSSLTASQINSLGDNLSNLSVSTAKLVGGFAGLNTGFLTSDSFAVLTSSQIAALTGKQLTALSKLFSAMSADQAQNLTSVQATQIAPTALAKLTPEAVSALDTKLIAALPAKTFVALTIDDLGALTDEQVAVLNATQIKALKSVQIQALPSSGLSTSALSGLTKQNITGLNLGNLSDDQFKALNATQFSVMSSQQIESIDDSRAALLSPGAMKALTSMQVNALPVTTISAIDAKSFKGLTAKNITGLSTEGVAALTNEQATVITPEQMAKFSFNQIKALTADNVSNLSLPAFKKISVQAISGLKVDALTDAEIKALSVAQIKGMSIEQFEKLNSDLLKQEQINAFWSVHIGDASSKDLAFVNKLSIDELVKMGDKLNVLSPITDKGMQDSASNILAKLNILEAQVKSGVLKQITVTDLPGNKLTVSKAQFLGSQNALGAISGNTQIVLPAGTTLSVPEAVTILDSVAPKVSYHNITIKDKKGLFEGKNFDKVFLLQMDPPFGHIIFTDSGIPDLIITKSQYTLDQSNFKSGKESLLVLIDSPYHLVISEVVVADIDGLLSSDSRIYGFSITDNAINITDNWTKLENLMANGKLYGVNSTTGTVTVPDSGGVSAAGASGTLIIDGSGSTDGATLIGPNASNNSITGGAGDDIIAGNGGIDTMTGGAGHDTFFISTPDLDTTTAAVTAVITDFLPGTDSIRLAELATNQNFYANSSVFDGLNTLLTAANTALDGTCKYYAAQSGGNTYLVFDDDGVGYTEVIQFTGLITLTSASIV